VSPALMVQFTLPYNRSGRAGIIVLLLFSSTFSVV
jgi:hypothetical protein